MFRSRYLSTFFDQSHQDLGDFRLPRGAEPRIRVVDTAGVPQSGVQLWVKPAELSTATEQRGFQHVLTDDDGVAQLETAIHPGPNRLTVVGREVVSGDGDFEVADPPAAEPAAMTVVVRAVPDARTASGHVVDADGKPVAGFLLYAFSKWTGGEVQVTARSAADGSFRIVWDGPLETFALKHPQRYGDWHEFGTHRWGSQDLTVTLAQSAALEFVVRAAGGGPVEDLAVHLVPVDSVLGAEPVRLTKSFAGGKVRIDGLRATRYFVRVHARGSPLWPTDWFECEATAAPEPVRVELEAPIARTVHVFTDQGRPVVGGLVELLYGQRDQLLRNSDRQDQFRDFGIVDRTMTGEESRADGFRGMETARGIVGDRAVTDRSGKVELRGRTTAEPVFLRVHGGGAQDTLHELPGWSAGRSAIVATVPGGGEVTGAITPADFIVRLDVSTEKERQDYARRGIGPNPWLVSLADLRASHRPGIALRRAGEAEIWKHCVAPLGDDGAFAFAGVPPGEYEVRLVLRQRQGEGVTDDVLDAPLAKVVVVTGECQKVQLEAPAAVRAAGH